MFTAASSFAQLLPFDGTALGCRVLAAAEAYGMGTPFAQFWLGEGCALCRLDDGLTLCGTPSRAAVQEALAFGRWMGAASLACPGGLPGADPVAEMELSVPSALPRPGGRPFACAPARAGADPLSLRAMHALLAGCASPAFQPPPFEPFYLDMSHRTRHGAAVAGGFPGTQGLDACVAAALSPAAALLFAGAVRPACRGRSLFAHLLARVRPLLGGRRALLLCGTGLAAHYRAMGFRRTGTVSEWRYGKRPAGLEGA